MSNDSGLTERQAFWLEHLRACGDGSLKAYAAAHGLEVGALYAAKATLKRKGVVSGAAVRLVRAERAAGASGGAPALCRVQLRNGTAVEVRCAPEHWEALLASVAALP